MQKKISDATASELADYAKIHHGIDGIRHTMGKERILAELRKVGFSADEITVEAPQVQALPKQTLKAEDFGSKQMVKIFISEQEGPGGSDPVFVAVNGRSILIPRNKEVVVRAPFVEALEHAVKRVPVKGENESIVGWREVPSFPYRVIGPVAA